MATHELIAGPDTIQWGFYDAKRPPVLTVASGDTLTVIYGDRSQGSPGWYGPITAPASDPLAVAVDHDGSGNFAMLNNLPLLHALPGEPVELVLTLESSGIIGKPAELHAAFLDLNYNGATGTGRVVRLDLLAAAVGKEHPGNYTAFLEHKLTSHLTGPEVGLNYSLGSKSFRLTGHTKFALMANFERLSLKGNNIGDANNIGDDINIGTPDPDEIGNSPFLLAQWKEVCYGHNILDRVGIHFELTWQ